MRHAPDSWKICSKFTHRRRNFLREFGAGRARFRQRTPHRLDATFLRRQKIFTAMPAEVVKHCASTDRKVENEFAHFLADKLRNLRAERALFQRSTACRPALELRRRLSICKMESSEKKTRSLRAARRKRGPFVEILQQIRASSTQFFVRVRRRTRAFSPAHAPPTR